MYNYLQKYRFSRLHMKTGRKRLMKYSYLIIIFAVLGFFCSRSVVAGNLPDPYSYGVKEVSKKSIVITPKVKSYSVGQDTIPLVDRQGDFITDKSKNPFDLNTTLIEQKVEYDVKTGKYIIYEKLGNEYYRTPTELTFDEYLKWKSKQQESDYFKSLNGIQSDRKFGKSLSLDPMSKIDIKKSMADRLFGGTDINIKPQGGIDLTLGFFTYYRSTGIFATGGRTSPWNPLDPIDMKPRLTVDGNVGSKMKLNFNYDAQSSFDFDRKIKLNYDSNNFSEDDIVKKIEAGNVSLPLKGNLIQGAQSLMGVKTDLQFGHLKMTLLASQQLSRQNNTKIQNGATVQDFEIRPDKYDENRHFFVSHFNRETYESSLANLPQVNTSYLLSQIEVWISDDRPDYQTGQTNIAAIADLAEGDLAKYNNPTRTLFPPTNPMPNVLKGVRNIPLADNRSNGLYQELIKNDTISDLDKTSTVLRANYGLEPIRDFEVFRGRLLNQSEYTYNPQLGFISLNTRLRPNQVLGVSYKYFYTLNCDEVYTVGQVASQGLETADSRSIIPGQQPDASPSKVLFVKLLKSSNPRISLPNYDLMMKNVYNLGTNQLNKEGFEFDVFYQDDYTDGSPKKYIPERPTSPLLNVFRLDNLNKFGDPQPDGVFDYVPGRTVIERSGSIVFPVLEPFGSSLDSLLKDPALLAKYKYQALYDSSLTNAVYSASNANNKFIMRGKVKSANNGEINLGPFVPKDGVKVSAGGIQLTEGVDYEIDYSLGKLRVLNPAYLSQSTPIDVNYEDQSAFSSLNKSMVGVRFDYDFSKKFTMGATYLKLWERPFTQKVNAGDDPINNRIFGLDMSYNDKVPWVTNMLDKLPFFSTKAESSFAFSAEGAYLKPGHNGAINTKGKNKDDEGGIINIDDFEGAISGFSLGGFNTNSWILSSTPPEYREATLTNDLRYGANRAKLAWYQVDQSVNSSEKDRRHPFSRIILQTDLFNRQVQTGVNQLFTFDVSYYPEERGPYNFDKLQGYPGYSAGTRIDDGKIRLNNPKSRWGGIMRYFQNPDFEANNYQFIEFWMLNPFLDENGNPKADNEDGEIVFQLGNVSEDVLRDNLQFYENALSTDQNPSVQSTKTKWGNVPVTAPLVNGFVLDQIKKQDVGFDGMTDEQERVVHDDWLNSYPTIKSSLQLDPSGDNFLFYNDESIKSLDMVTRMKNFSGPDGNTPEQADFNNNIFFRGSRTPDSEDMDNDRSLDQGEAYYKYVIKIKNKNGEIDTAASRYFRQVREVRPGEKWYRMVVPISEYTEAKGIEGFRSIQFMRMFFSNFEKQKTFRFAEFQLVRNQWRVNTPGCKDGAVPDISLDEVGVEENFTRLPINYRLAPGIQQEILNSSLGANLRQDEKSLALRFCNLQSGCEVSISKLARMELNLYKKLQMFNHLEGITGDDIEDGDISVFVRLAKDIGANYYEYVMPLKPSDFAQKDVISNIWPDTNKINVLLEKFVDLKKARIVDKGVTEIADEENEGAKFIIKGVPSLGDVNFIEIGIRNTSASKTLCGTAWVNELRAVGLNEEAAWAAQAKAQLKLADLGDINAAASYSSIGFGKLDQRLLERSRDEIMQVDVSTSLQLGKLLPKFLPINLPFFAQYTKSTTTPQYDPYQKDIKVADLIAITTGKEQEDVRDRARETTTIKSYNVNNVKIDAGSSDKPWSLSNVNASYSYNQVSKVDPVIENDVATEVKGTIDYGYSGRPSYIQPLKFIKPKALKLLSEFNFNLIPSALGFNTNIEKYDGYKQFRLPDVPVFRFDDQRYKWDRNYVLDWDLTKSLRMNFKATNSSVIDQLRQVGIAETAELRSWVNAQGQAASADTADQYRANNFKRLGRAKNYNHSFTVNYKLPINLLPMMDWVTSSAEYRSTYAWNTSPLIFIDELNNRPGGLIQNTQARTLNATFAFDKLYGKWGYLKRIENGGPKNPKKKKSEDTPKDGDTPIDGDAKTDAPKDAAAAKAAKKEKKKSDTPRTPSIVERVLIRPLLSLRSVKFNYKEELGSVIPGIVDSNFYGALQGFKQPGWQFAAGLQPNLDKNDANNFLQKNKTWFNSSPNFNDQITQNERQNINLKVVVEPFKDFTVNLDFNKDYRNNHAEIFKSKDGTFMQIARVDMGAFETSYASFNTLFNTSELNFAKFKANRPIVANAQYIANTGNTTIVEHPDYKGFPIGYGPASFNVVVPSFISAYTNQDINNTALDLRSDIRNYNYIPRPNWNLRYDGLSKLPFFKDFLSSFSLKHGYKSTLSVARFNTDISYRDNNPFLLNEKNNYYAEIEIPAVVIKEDFSPLIGIDMRTKNNMDIKVEYKKGRQLDLRATSSELAETLNTSFVFGYGYIIDNFKGFGSSTKKKRPTRKKTNEFDVADKTKDEPEEDPKDKKAAKKKSDGPTSRKLTINCDVSFRDEVTQIYKLDAAAGSEGPNRNRGQKGIQINPTVEYQMYKNLALRFYFEYQSNTPYTPGSYANVNMSAGTVVRYTFN
jgi:cell surface protein SprA